MFAGEEPSPAAAIRSNGASTAKYKFLVYTVVLPTGFQDSGSENLVQKTRKWAVQVSELQFHTGA